MTSRKSQQEVPHLPTSTSAKMATQYFEDDEFDILSCAIPATYPYRFEPMARRNQDNDSSSETDSEGEEPVEVPILSPERGPDTVRERQVFA